MQEEKHFDPLNPFIILGGVAAFMADLFSLFFIPLLFFPVFGLPLGISFLILRYMLAGGVCAFVWHILKGGFLPKLALAVGFIIPLPLFMSLGLLFAIILQAKIARTLAVVGLTVATGGLAGAAAATTGRMVGGVALRAAAKAGIRTAGRRVATRAGRKMGQWAIQAGVAKAGNRLAEDNEQPDFDERAFGMPGEPIEELQEELFENSPGQPEVQPDQSTLRSQ